MGLSVIQKCNKWQQKEMVACEIIFIAMRATQEVNGG